MKQTLDVLNAMQRDHVIGPYALAGAVAAFKYLEPAVTQDLDVLVSFQAKSGLVDLGPVFDDLRARGYTSHQSEGIVIEGWPVQFIPVTDETSMRKPWRMRKTSRSKCPPKRPCEHEF